MRLTVVLAPRVTLCLASGSLMTLQHPALSPQQAVDTFPSHLKVRLQLLENTCCSRGSKNTPENCWQRTGPLGAKSATVPSTGGQQLYPLPSRPPTAAPSRCSTPPPGLPFSSLPAAHSAENTGYEGADWQWSVSSPQSSAPSFNPGPGLSTTNAFCSAQPRSVSPLKHK